MKLNTQDQTALVTGASSGIGRATALKLAEEGIYVAITGRREEALQALCQEIEAQGGHSIYLTGDLTDQRHRELCIHRVMETWGRLNILVNAAGIIGSGSIENTSMEEWDRMFDINLRSLFHLTQLAVPHLVETRGAIVNVSSVTGLRAFPNVLSYCVSKAGVDQFTRCIALELAPKGVRVNAINPGVVRTNLHRRGGMDENAYAQFVEHSRSTHPLGRIGEPEEAAELILFLATNRSSWITGTTISIDGGRAQTCAR